VEQEAEKADVVHNHGLWLAANYYARRAAGKAGKPLVISLRGMLEDWSLGRSKMRKRVAWMLFERENLRSAKLFHATAESEAESIREALRRWKMGDGSWESPISDLRSPISTEPRIVVAANGVEVPEKIPGREVLERRFPELKGRRFVLFMSRIHPKKGVDLLLKAWSERLRDEEQAGGGRREEGYGLQATGYRNNPSSISQLPSAASTPVLVIAGADLVGYGEEVKRMIREKGLEGGVVMTGHVDGEVREALLGHAEFMVLPSHSENFGLVVAESLAAGRPALTTVGTPWGRARSEIKMKIKIKENMNLEERKCGVICEVTDLKRGLERMLEFSDQERQEMGARGRQWMKEEFSWEAGAEKLTSAYQEVIG
jgi:glycosyltransferase involved in cell wall biosynthesis